MIRPPSRDLPHRGPAPPLSCPAPAPASPSAALLDAAEVPSAPRPFLAIATAAPLRISTFPAPRPATCGIPRPLPAPGRATSPLPAPLCPLMPFLYEKKLALKFNVAAWSSSLCSAGCPGPEPGSRGVPGAAIKDSERIRPLLLRSGPPAQPLRPGTASGRPAALPATAPLVAAAPRRQRAWSGAGKGRGDRLHRAWRASTSRWPHRCTRAANRLPWAALCGSQLPSRSIARTLNPKDLAARQL